ncbi:cysteine desulfurase [Adlercreutzia sp. R21]|uniref:aminotransferase class V-fold PLP-dependent enzyme n=1 Tax=Adlercreutzia wanghongyangiae TaxID=3111451 RepID=UPI002DB7B342|nr:cysteine desulfurase [Adlercreutzia sp. R21]MEC4183365.1 cysteine desulfurase [Adlercreutzia sp. R21]
MADAMKTPLDRGRYPILERKVGADGAHRLVYLDSAATALVSATVTDAHAAFLHTSCANIHRGAHLLAEEATDAYECARERLASFFGAPSPEAVVLTHGATESLNLAALGWGRRHLRAGDIVAVAADNHHSNIVPWQMLAEERGVEVAWIPVGADGLLDLSTWHRIAERSPKAVALCHRSNVLGFAQPALATILNEARSCGALIVLDGAQAAAHIPVDLSDTPFDFYGCSAHKMGGLAGVGALVCSERAIGELSPLVGGGGMAARVDDDGYAPLAGPAGFEAGTPPVAAAAVWPVAIDLLEAAGLDTLAAHVSVLAEAARHRLASIPGVRVIGDEPGRAFESLVSFTVDGVHPHDVSQHLSDAGVMVRAGHHCAKPLHRALGLKASLRASFGGYSADDDVDALVAAVEERCEKRRTC